MNLNISNLTKLDPDSTKLAVLEIPFRSVGISFDYRFGNLKFKERKTSIKNTDLLQGGDGQQQGGQQGGGNG